MILFIIKKEDKKQGNIHIVCNRGVYKDVIKNNRNSIETTSFYSLHAGEHVIYLEHYKKNKRERKKKTKKSELMMVALLQNSLVPVAMVPVLIILRRYYIHC
jgi:hypothetical protein